MELLRLYIKRRTDYKMSNNLWDFGDMLEQVVYQEIIPDDVNVIIQDECQDWTPLLARIAGMWAEKAERVYMAADPYQCIYEWMSADPSIIINTKVDKTMVLKQSYRCPIKVHDLSREIVNGLVHGTMMTTIYQDKSKVTLYARFLARLNGIISAIEYFTFIELAGY